MTFPLAPAPDPSVAGLNGATPAPAFHGQGSLPPACPAAEAGKSFYQRGKRYVGRPLEVRELGTCWSCA